MSNIFISDFSNNILYDFLNYYCIIENNHYIFNNLIYKKYAYQKEYLNNFLDALKKLYKKQKKFYLERDVTYNNILTIIRHICKYKSINYFSKIIYDKNSYVIIYNIEYIN